MFNFSIVLADHGKVTDADRATTCKCSFKATLFLTKVQKKKDNPKTWVYTVKQFEHFIQEKESTLLTSTKQPRKRQSPSMQSEDEPRKQKETNWRKIVKKAFRLKLSGFCKTRTKKSSPEMFNFYVVLAGSDIITDAERATTCRCNFRAPLI